MNSVYRPALGLAVLILVSLSGCGSSSNSDGDTPDGDEPTNSVPVIFGSPSAAVKVDEEYSFTPGASDADGDVLSFTIENKPPWADFDSSDGTISGVPTAGDIGNYSNISISVSDGTLSASLPNFAIDVTQMASASISLSWTAPTQNEDGSTLTDLDGFIIYYGKSPGDYSEQIRIENASVTNYLVENLTPDTYYFAAAAFNQAGIVGRLSGEASKTLN